MSELIYDCNGSQLRPLTYHHVVSVYPMKTQLTTTTTLSSWWRRHSHFLAVEPETTHPTSSYGGVACRVKPEASPSEALTTVQCTPSNQRRLYCIFGVLLAALKRFSSYFLCLELYILQAIRYETQLRKLFCNAKSPIKGNPVKISATLVYKIPLHISMSSCRPTCPVGS